LPSEPDRPIVCYVTNGRDFPEQTRYEQTVRCVRAALDAGADWVQIREKDVRAPQLLALVREAIEIALPQERAQRVLVNERLDIAIAAGAAGVHLRSESAPTDAVVRWCRGGNAPEGFLIGRSCHSLEDARKAAVAGADYVFFGPIFDSPAKRAFGRPQGIERLSEVCSAVRIPVIAIGGVNDQNAADCIQAGASGVAAIRLFQAEREPTSLAQIVSQIHALRLPPQEQAQASRSNLKQ
jgi:thiamine-phosphate pyrophosphorylase